VNTYNPEAVAPGAALERLREGNARFVAGKGTAYTGFRADLADGQSPFAVVVGCSDSRAPSEIVFDVGLGDLFVVRVAGNIVAPSQVGSVEFAVANFGTRLVVVMGHTRCGAIAATLRVLGGAQAESRNLASITDRIAPNIREVAAAHQDAERRTRACVTANVRASVAHLSYGSRLLEELVLNKRVAIVGAVYAVETGVVSVLEDDVVA
jgi:carbonic anhydrase